MSDIFSRDFEEFSGWIVEIIRMGDDVDWNGWWKSFNWKIG